VGPALPPAQAGVGVPDARPVVALVAHEVHDDGGMERACAELVRRANGRYRWVVVSTRLAPDLRAQVEWRRVPVPPRPFPLRFVVFGVLAGLRLARMRPDLVHTVGAIVPNRVDVAAVHFCHAGYRQALGALAPPGSPPLRRVNTGLVRVLSLIAERWCYRPSRLRAMAAVSPGVARELEAHYPGVPVTVTPNGVDTDRYRPDPAVRSQLRQAEAVRPDEVVALFVGGDWDRKGLHIAIAALAVARQAGAPVRLWVVGPGDEGRFAALALEEGVEASVRFFGAQPAAERFFQAADVFVLPTLYETFSLVAYEAAACGLAVVASRVAGIEDLVGDDEAGVLVAREPEPVGKALAWLALNPSARREMGEAGRRRCRQYTWARSVDSVVELYERLTDPGLRP